MKLKLLLIPFSVLISLILVIWHIYPTLFGNDVDSVKNIRKEVAKIESDIARVKATKNNVQKLKQSMDSDTEMREAILNYYSTTRKDEDIINNLNNIAFNEGVYLEDMDLEYLKIDGQEDPIKLMSLKNIEAIPVSTMNADSTVIGATPDLAISEAVDQISLNSKISYIGTTLLGSGDYYQIKNFLVAANKIGLLNNVQSFNISKDEDGNAEEGGDPNKLSFKLVIGFGYFKESKSQVVDLIGSPVLTLNGFDFKDIEKNKDLLTGNYQKSEVGETGLANPFIP